MTNANETTAARNNRWMVYFRDECVGPFADFEAAQTCQSALLAARAGRATIVGYYQEDL